MSEEKRFQGDHVGSADKIQEQKPAPATAVAVQANENGLLVGRTLDEQWRLAVAYTKSGILPIQYNTPEKVLTAMQFCIELGLRPLSAMRQIAVINGVPSMYGDLPLGVVRGSGKLESIDEYFVDESGLRICPENKNIQDFPYGAVCVTKRKDVGTVTTFFSVDDAKAAGLWGKKVWAVYPKRMLQMRARSQNLKDNFPEVLNGVAIAEYDFNVSKDEIDSGQASRPTVQDLNERLKTAEASVPEIIGISPTIVKIEEKELETIEVVPEEAAAIEEVIMDKPDHTVTFGRFTGMKVSEILPKDRTALFFSLKGSEKLSGEMQRVLEVLQAYV